MGKGWKVGGMLENAAKKGRIFTKLAREITVATKLGGPDPGSNSRLRMAIDAAREESCPKDTIERAIKRGSGQLDDDAIIEELTYEGYGPHGVGVIVECQTDNKNRAASEVRTSFKSHGGNMGESGSVAWMFNRVGLVEGKKAGTFDPDEEAIEAGADEVEKHEDGSFAFYTTPDNVGGLSKALAGRGWKVDKAELSYKAKDTTTLTEIQMKDVVKFLQELDDHDDTHRVHATI
ncbi:MAG: YebC/PmpR family DNA-binding transcriptional regulator [Pseudobdellovibrionaceae bacterium]